MVLFNNNFSLAKFVTTVYIRPIMIECNINLILTILIWYSINDFKNITVIDGL